MDTISTHIRVGNLSDVGLNPIRSKNEDAFGYYTGEYGSLLIVCDGMGGHNAGEVAAQLAVESVKNYFDLHYIAGDENATLELSIDFAHKKILECSLQNPELDGMGTTLVLLLIRDGQFWYANVGDSRIYLRRESMYRLTKDHSEVQALVEMGVISQEDARNHPRRNIITQALGSSNCTPEVSGPHMLYRDDVFMLCSDGLSNYFADEEFFDFLADEPQIACINLVEEAKRRGGDDNITVQVVHVLHGSPLRRSAPAEVSNRPKLNPRKYILPAVIVVLAGYIVFLTPKLISRIKNRASRAPIADSLAVTETETAPQMTITKKKPEDKKAPAVQAATKTDTALEAKLTPVAPDANSVYGAYHSKLLAANPQAQLPKRLMFIRTPEADRVAYVTPGNTVYLAYSDLANNKKVNEETIKIFFIGLAMAMGNAKEPMITGERPLDAATLEKARAIYLNMDPGKEGAYTFKRVADKLVPNIRLSGNSIIYRKPQ